MVNDLILNRFFTRSTFQKLIDGEADSLFSSTIRHCQIDPMGKSNERIIGEIYRYLGRSYRNEYYYKNTLLNTLLLGRHKPTTTTALTEVPVGKAKADFILINGKAIVYEIKTQLDNLERLEHQINEYYRAFRYVVVVTYPENYSIVEQYIKNPYVGIYVITKQGTISKKLVREPKEYIELLDKETIFHILRKTEYEYIIQRHCGRLPQTTAFKYYKACYAEFVKVLTPIQAQKELELVLKRRICIDPLLFSSIPKELRFVAYFSDMKSSDYQHTAAFLNRISEEAS